MLLKVNVPPVEMGEPICNLAAPTVVTPATAVTTSVSTLLLAAVRVKPKVLPPSTYVLPAPAPRIGEL